MVTINKLVEIVSQIADKKIKINHIDGPTGVRGRNSDNTLIKNKLGWNYEMTLAQGIEKTYKWIESQINE
jgi:nucleoside-diphosphate-sugar epimerase